MEVRIRPLNKGETFACSIRKAKKLFKDTDVILNFAFATRQYGLYNIYSRKNNNRIIASMHMYNEQKRVLLNFYALKQDIFTEALKEEFENNFLIKFYDFYQSLQNAKILIPQEHLMLAELDNGTLKISIK
jgi:hypothetical protein